MDKFEFGPFDESISDGPFMDASYVNTKNEQVNRKEFSHPLMEIRDWLNNGLFDGDAFLLDDLLLTDGNIEIQKVGKKYKLILAVSPEGVTKAYVDYQDGETLQSAKDYTDLKISQIPEYQLPTATDEVKGGVKVGNGLSMDNETLETDILIDIESIEMTNGETATIKLNETIESAEPSETGKVNLSFVGKTLTIEAIATGSITLIINGTKTIALSIS